MGAASAPAVHRGPLEPGVADEVRGLAAEVERHDGVEALGEQTLLSLLDPRAVHVLARDDGGVLVGYGQLLGALEPPATGELVVAPQARRRGRGARVLSALRGAADGDPPAVWAHGNLPAAQALAAAAGMGVVRELWRMDLDLRGRPRQPSSGRPAPPPGTVVRPFVVGQDEAAWLAVNSAAFADHPEQGRVTPADLQARQREPWFSPSDLLLVESAGRVVASVWMKVEPGSTAGELYVLGVHPEAQGTGLGRLLTRMVLDHLGDLGLETAYLYTSATNAAAVRTYGAAGFRTTRVDVQYR